MAYKPNLLYVFRRPVTKLLEQVKQQQIPEDIFYGLTRMGKNFNVVVTDTVFRYPPFLFIQQLLSIVVFQFMDIGFSLIPATILLPQLKQADLIFATVDTYGLPIAFFKKMGFIPAPLIFNTIGLYDGLIKKQNKLAISFCRTILSCVDHFVSGGSFQECEKLAHLLNIPLKKFTFIPFGIDTHFFHTKRMKSHNFILVIGADPSRDWKLYASIAKKLPAERFLIITYKGLVKIPMPANATFLYNVKYKKLREHIWQSKCVVILSQFNYHFAGQSTAFRAMSCGKPVIFTTTPGVEEYELKHNRDCILVPSGNVQTVIAAITAINSSVDLKRILGQNARRVIKTEYNLYNYAQSLEKVFMNCLLK